MISPLEHILLLVKLTRLHSRIEYPFRNVRAANRIEFGRNIRIKKHAWFSLTTGCRASIGDNTRVGRHFVLAGVDTSIVIGENVLISERVFISEANHDFTDVTRPVVGMGSVSGGPVRIGSDSWLGIGVCVLPNVTIGRHCVIGANAVVTHDIPDYSLAAGVPAKVRKRFDFDKNQWVSTGADTSGS